MDFFWRVETRGAERLSSVLSVAADSKLSLIETTLSASDTSLERERLLRTKSSSLSAALATCRALRSESSRRERWYMPLHAPSARRRKGSCPHPAARPSSRRSRGRSRTSAAVAAPGVNVARSKGRSGPRAWLLHLHESDEVGHAGFGRENVRVGLGHTRDGGEYGVAECDGQVG